jgi:hypothetical protein
MVELVEHTQQLCCRDQAPAPSLRLQPLMPALLHLLRSALQEATAEELAEIQRRRPPLDCSLGCLS